MYNFNNWDLIKESLKTARETYLETEYVTKEEFDKIKSIDPSKTFKYIDAMLNFYVNGYVDDLDALKLDIKNFHNLAERGLIKNKDINALEYLDFKAELLDAQSKIEIKELQKSKDTDTIIVKDDEKFLIVIPNTYEASCKYGHGTKWCTASKNEPWHFSNYRYLNKVTLYYIHNKKLPETNPMYKTSVVVDQWHNIYECYNALDELIFIDDILKMGINRSIFKYVPPKLPKDMVEAYEEIGDTTLNKIKFVKILKDVTELFDNKNMLNMYLVNHDGKLDILRSTKNGKLNHLIGWHSDTQDRDSMWETLYYSALKNKIDNYSKIYKFPPVLSEIIKDH